MRRSSSSSSLNDTQSAASISRTVSPGKALSRLRARRAAHATRGRGGSQPAKTETIRSGLSKTFDEIMDRLSEVEHAERSGASGISIPKKKIHYAKVEILNQLAIGAFIVGVLLLGFFVGYNLWVGPAY